MCIRDRPCPERSVGGGEWFEIFAVVADPATGAEVRVFHLEPRADLDPAAVGLLTAEKLMEAGAGPLLEAANEASK